MTFLRNYGLLILALLGAALALVGALTKAVIEKPSRRIVVWLAVLSFLVLVAQQLLSKQFEAQASAARKQSEANRDTIIQAIRGTVQRTEGVVNTISQRLRGASIGQVGIPLVTPDSGAARSSVQVLGYGKGSPQDWEQYARWVVDNRKTPGRQLALTFDLNADHHYVVMVMLGYLFVSPEKLDELRTLVGRGGWSQLADPGISDRFLQDWRGVDWVLFHDGRDGPVVAWASAREFTQAVVLLQRLGRSNAIEQVLNRRAGNAVSELARLVPTLDSAVVHTAQVDSVVRAMLTRKWSRCLADADSGTFLVPLERVIRAAS